MADGQDADRWEAAYASGRYREHWDSLTPASDLVGFLAAGTLLPAATVVDLGCGAGTNAVFIAGLGFRVIGVDISPSALEIARGRAVAAGVTVDWRRGSVLDLPVDSGSIDLAYDRGCFHGIGAADRDLYADEVHRVLRPGGRLLLHGGRVAGEAAREPVDGEAVDRFFSSDRFQRGPVLPFLSHSDAGEMEANLVLLTRR
jgi:SAM-dependent methyltransferase